MKKVSMNDLDHVIKLSHLSIPDNEKQDYLEKLDSILTHVDQLSKMDLEGVDPSSYARQQKQHLRDDEVVKQDDLFLAKNAPDWEEGCFSVPQIIG